MNRATSDQRDDDDELIRLFIAEAGDPYVEPRPEHVAHVRSLLLERLVSPQPARRWKRGLLVGSGLAAMTIALAMLALSRPAIAWAQVAEALHRRPWVHGKMVGPDGNELFEHWLSSNRDLAGVRGGPAILFHDFKRKVFTKYILAENVVYRLPEPPKGKVIDFDFLTHLLDLLLDPAGPSKFPFPGMELIGQTRKEVEADGRKWLEIELSLRVAGGSQGGPLSTRIRVDPMTKLPKSFAEQDEDGKWYTATIDYPDRGPADIYDLGVPRTAKVIDRVPLGDVDRVLAELKAGRARFDNYCAFVVQERVLPTYYFPRVTAYRVWRKGPKWRVEQLRPERKDWGPPTDVDTRWWKEHQGDFVFVPRSVCDGKLYWDYYLGDEWKPGMPVPQVGSGKTVGPNQLSGPADDPVLPFWCQDLLPEQAGHPTAGIYQPDHDREFLVEHQPGDGPPGTIVLRGRDTNAQVAGAPDHFRLWLDPKANYLSMRTELRVSDQKDVAKVAFIDTHILESVARSPKGYWYPTRSRQIAFSGKHEVVRNFSMDFASQVPDELFQPLQ
jgi:hypothetical protein